eukprot:195277_1
MLSAEALGEKTKSPERVQNPSKTETSTNTENSAEPTMPSVSAPTLTPSIPHRSHPISAVHTPTLAPGLPDPHGSHQISALQTPAHGQISTLSDLFAKASPLPSGSQSRNPIEHSQRRSIIQEASGSLSNSPRPPGHYAVH